jgi:recombination endonuclease VII
MAPAPCSVCGVRPKQAGRHKCGWCYLATRPILEQVKRAEMRLAWAQAQPGYERRGRVPEREWPAGMRWCASCQWMVPLEYTSGSRCKACASKAAHAYRVNKQYSVSAQEYEALYQWQDGRCYICGKRTQMRLAVDHDHRTGAVRGLLCANNEWGCNVALRVILDDLEAARRLVDYIRKAPIRRMQDGEPQPFQGEAS